MSTLFPRGIITLFLIAFSFPLIAVDFMRYPAELKARDMDETTSATITGIIESCGSASSLDDSCVLQNLNRVTEEESNNDAKALLADYESALAQGNYNTIPECQTDTNLQVNRNVGHCILLLNYHALKNPNIDEVNMQYLMCLQGSMLGLAYEGNLAAQLMLSQIFEQRGVADSALFWRRALEQRKGSEEYDAVIKCYQ